jgi:hypothetical protein
VLVAGKMMAANQQRIEAASDKPAEVVDLASRRPH